MICLQVDHPDNQPSPRKGAMLRSALNRKEDVNFGGEQNLRDPNTSAGVSAILTICACRMVGFLDVVARPANDGTKPAWPDRTR